MGNVIYLFVIGFSYFFGPCLGFCTPLIISYFIPTRTGIKPALKSAVVFSAVRSFTHIILSVIIFSSGRLVINVLHRYNWIIFAVAGTVICILGILIFLGRHYNLSLSPFSSPLGGEGGVRGKNSTQDVVLLGLLTGISPCLPHIAVWVYITVEAKSIGQSLVYALSFGAGEFIPPILLGLLSGKISSLLRGNFFIVVSRICGLLLFGIGLRLLLTIK
ncbi:MAG: hypothetical protein AUJ85_09455 [Elusimicrobia bacterium CG1_02_37_114]|nr:MAG: hypothetical protein AUJ85_09455 [Elusimicrobia bacterium CG1_02_37_114]PIV52478.1 MAG: hypothetical protein COS17_08930 [Elusimicrobia bacterium CG02_land_8_20_14_3_00_37_13]PIZ12643.1 MAG: hypothetical protein COY53_08950 [Elusimicrobia bacterium CG_4_10_14_0_8_um_filter_37_32]